MTAVRRTRAFRAALTTGVAVSALVAGPTLARAQGASQGYPVGSSASAVAAQTFDGARAPSRRTPPPPTSGRPPRSMPSVGRRAGRQRDQPAAPLVMTPQQAQEAEQARRDAQTRAEQDDGLEPGGFYLEADLVIRDDKAKTITARGGVESRYDGRTLRANEVTYDQTTGVVTARGAASLTDADGNVQFADELVLDDDQLDRLRAQLLGPTGRQCHHGGEHRRAPQPTVNELNNALYTPCPICAEDPSKPPSWSFRADKVVEDRESRSSTTATPGSICGACRSSMRRCSGTPSPQAKRKFGPADAEDLGLQEARPVLRAALSAAARALVGHHRQPADQHEGQSVRQHQLPPAVLLGHRPRCAPASPTTRTSTIRGDKFGDSTFRSYILAKGRFDLSDKWLWGFSAERASEDLVLDKYDIGDIYLEEARGLFPDQERRFSSQLYTIRQDERTFLSVSAVSGFQGADRLGRQRPHLPD
jgi:LPS-assembly protein